MRVIIQRVSSASVKIDGVIAGEIDKGLLILLGVSPDDTHSTIEKVTNKILKLRIFEDDQGKMNLSVLDVSGQILMVSQFTLYADLSKGNRPSFSLSAPPEMAEKYYNDCINLIRSHGVTTQTGKFGADMKVALVNDGPVTICIDSKDL